MRRIRLGVLVLVGFGAAAMVPAQPYTEATAGIVDIEAENYSAIIGPRSAHDWVATTATAGYSGPGAMTTTPNTTNNVDANWTADSPELQYQVSFINTGTHYVWLRGYGATADDDSAHVSINGGTGTSAARITLPTPAVASYRWTSTQLTTGNRTTISVPSAGSHTLNMYMREDGFIVDRILLTTNVNLQAIAGNAFHIPSGAEPGIASMRLPFREIAPDTAVTIYSGNQFQGTGNPGNQFVTGSALKYRKLGTSTWTSLNLTFDSQSANNKYFRATIPASSFNAGDTVQYYIKALYDDHLPTYIYGTDSDSNATETESVAQAAPFSYTIQAPLTPSGSFVSISSGGFEGRVYQTNGYIELLQPNLAGTPLASSVSLAPPGAVVGDQMYYVGSIVTSTPSGGGLDLVQNLGSTTIQARLSFAATGVLRYEVTNWGAGVPTETYVRAASPTDEHFYGFGEKFNSFDQAGKVVRMLNFDQPNAKGDSSYKVAPWFMSTRGYGLYFDSSAEGVWDMRSSAADRYSISNPDSPLKLNLIAGPRLTDTLERYTGLTGRPHVPPEWVFGPWISTDKWRTGGEVRYAISKMVAQGIPCSVIVFDSPWEVSYNDFTWNTSQFAAGGTYETVNYPGFASIAQMMDFLRSNGVKVICWMTPFVNTVGNNDGVPGQNLGQAPNYAAGASNNYFVRASAGGPPLVVNWWKGTGSPVDFTNPAAVTWLQGQLQTLINGSVVTTPSSQQVTVIGGFKTDDGEAAGTTNTYIPETAVYFDGRTGVQMRNGYALEYHKSIWNVLGNDGVLFARSGYAGSQAYPAGWSGDNDPNFTGTNGLPSVIVASQSSAMSGFSMWSCDVGGYIDGNYVTNTSDLFMRWAQFGALTPIMQMHRQIGSENQYPWNYSAAALDNYRECAKLHSRLFPYIYSYAHEANTTGLPIMRPLVLLNQDDPNVWGINHTYLFGNELLVAPVIVESTTTRTVYLPAGTWYDYWNNTAYIGGQNINWSNPDSSKFPLFVRGGSVVPMLQDAPQSLCPADYVDNVSVSTKNNDLDILVYPAATFGFSIYDGTTITGTQNTPDTTIAFASSGGRDVQYRVFGGQPPAVRLGSTALTQAANQSQYDGLASGWWYNTATNTTWIKFTHGSGTSTVVMGPLPSSLPYTTGLSVW